MNGLIWLYTIFDEKEDAPDASFSLKLVKPEESKKIDGITEMVEFIRWYQHQIFVKLKNVKGELKEEGLELMISKKTETVMPQYFGYTSVGLTPHRIVRVIFSHTDLQIDS